MDPLELGSIAVIVLVLFLWGPQKIPELARTVAAARKEFDNATKEFQKFSTSIQNGTSPLLAPAPTPAKAAPSPSLPQPGVRSVFPTGLPAPVPGAKTGDELLLEAARKLGISTAGKTREQIQQDIVEKAQSAQPPAETSQGAKNSDSNA